MPPRLLALLVLALLLSACFEPPVDETVSLRFLPDGGVVVTTKVELSGGDNTATPALNRRLAEVRQALLEGSDPWSRRFAEIHPPLERSTWEKQLGEIQKQTHSGVLAQPRDLAAFFGDTSLNLSYEIKEGTAELLITPGAPSRATRRQRELTKKTLATWTQALARYFSAGEALYRDLDEHPERAKAVLGALYADLLSDTDKAALPALTKEEKERVEQVQAAMHEVWSVLDVPEGEDHTPDELSHLVYDPFPGRLTVRLPGPPLESPEGFAPAADGTLTAAGPGLWQALRTLQGRWLAPDPILIYIDHQRRTPNDPLDLAPLLRQTRHAEPAPDATEVRLAIEQRLLPVPVYRVAWRVDPKSEMPFRWEPGEGATAP
ncbi:MAG TPA: hypothetical protein VH988_17175 [Thermoanaerobaculia bacterium]|jgi:hypothetical protein|nr:hypothetical protein [Thermoanaerobaculia bacterium]